MVVIACTPSMMDKWDSRLKKLSEVEPRFHSANTDEINGCPDIPTDRKINRYIESLKICDSPGNPFANSTYNEIMRNSHKYLTFVEYEEFVKKLRVQKIGSYNRNDAEEVSKASARVQKLVKKAFDCCTTCNIHCSHTKLKRCSKCAKQLYCSVECQKADWKEHQKECWGV